MRLDHLLSKEEVRIAFLFGRRWGREKSKDKTVPVAMREGEIPVPIPNTTVKTFAADGTMLETAWESRRLPGLFYTKLQKR